MIVTSAIATVIFLTSTLKAFYLRRRASFLGAKCRKIFYSYRVELGDNDISDCVYAVDLGCVTVTTGREFLFTDPVTPGGDIFFLVCYHTPGALGHILTDGVDYWHVWVHNLNGKTCCTALSRLDMRQLHTEGYPTPSKRSIDKAISEFVDK